MQKPTRIEFPG